MQTILATINAKYIHTSLAMRLLYVANKDRFDISFQEYTLKEDIQKIADALLATGCDVVGLGVYIWNVKQIFRLIGLLKERRPALIVVLGGPEVTYEPAYFLAGTQVDYVVSGEGEFVLGELLEAIRDGRVVDIEGVSSQTKISSTVVRADLDKIATLPSPYQLPEDRDAMRHRVVYMETTRGCPFQCKYCQASLEKGVRYFPEKYVFENLDYLVTHGARQIKFLDRTFNQNRSRAQAILDFLIDRYRPGLSCQFEVYADLLNDRQIKDLNERLPARFIRFEAGIQTTHEATNRAIGRKQDFGLLAANIRQLMDGGKIDLHLDLIAGLPYETYERFTQSFNDVFALKAKEVQLGFLKMLRGTVLRKDAAIYNYMYAQEAPYEVIAHAHMSKAELDRLRRAERMLENYWNSGRYIRTMQALFDTSYHGKYFELFDEIATFVHTNRLPVRSSSLEESFLHLQNFLTSKGIDLFTTLRTDYYHCFATRPPGFWESTLDKKTRKRLLSTIGNDKDFLRRHQLTRRMVEKRAVIDPVGGDEYLLTIFPEDKTTSVFTIQTVIPCVVSKLTYRYCGLDPQSH